MKRQIFSSILLTALISMLLMSCLIFIVMYRQFYRDMTQTVEKETGIIAEGYMLSGERYLKRLSTDTIRVTLISADGTVLFDSLADPAAMENHLDRPEVRDALETGSGKASRLSETLGRQTFYHAIRLDGGSILRSSVTTDIVYATVVASVPLTLLAIAAVAVLSALVARWRTGRIITPINQINLDDPLQNDVWAELSPLLTRLERQHRKIGAQLEELQKMQDEFSAITGSMSEGLILLNKNGTILSINKSAARLYRIDRDYVGKDILTVDRSIPVQELLKEASAGRRAETAVAISGRTYQFVANPVLSSGQIVGTILLAFDITERSHTEKLRREFTANVSHELKTPLQSIMGSAELMKNGLVRDEDLPRFIGRVYDEARRLVELVDDIIRLSQIDEMRPAMQRENVELKALCEDAAGRLKSSAAERGVTIDVTGEEAAASGVRQLLYEIVYNLIDNAVKYNRPGGQVRVTVSSDEAGTALSVADTGIGIPKEDQSRIFERFYRVDKSHSRDTGGTGLGLSIVKHAAHYHGADIELLSNPGAGTTMTVRFPRS
ncbi:MAG: PAS domain-containing protein [Clostridiales bacterium]|nr:PAS domain-containing protein [Clostridiales bacterium]